MSKKILLTLFVAITTLIAQPRETWNVGESVYVISTIDLEPNVDAQYLNQMKRTWGNNMDVFVAEGLVEEYHIFQSVNQYDGDFDLLLMVKYKNLAMLDSNKKNNKRWRLTPCRQQTKHHPLAIPRHVNPALYFKRTSSAVHIPAAVATALLLPLQHKSDVIARRLSSRIHGNTPQN